MFRFIFCLIFAITFEVIVVDGHMGEETHDDAGAARVMEVINTC